MSSEFVDVDGLRIAVRREGAGPAVLLLHGAVCDGRVWSRVADEVADAFTLVAWDAPGCGESSDAPAAFRMPDFAAAAGRVVGELGLAPVHVIGHSWGSAVALELCLRAPSAVRSLVLVGAYAGWRGSLSREEVAQRLAFALAAADRIEAGDWDPPSMPGLFSDAMPPDSAAELAAIMADVRAPGTRTMAHALAESDLLGALGSIDVPTLVVAGERDERSPLPVAERIAGGIPGARLSVLAGLGHECYLEDPKAFADTVRAFLEGATDDGA